MSARILGSLAGLLALGVLALLSNAPDARSQQQVGNKKDDETAYKTSFPQRNALSTGERKPSGPADQKLMESMANYFIGRLTWGSEAEAGSQALVASNLAPYHDDLERELLQPLLLPTSEKKNRMFVDQLGVHLAKTFKAVLARDFADKNNRVILINAALMLPPVAKLKQQAMGDLLVEIIKDPKQHDAVKVYAVKALREFFPAEMLSIGANLKDPVILTKFKRDNDRLEALVSFIDRKGPVPTNPEEREAIRYLRREAIMSLGHIGVPALAALKKKGAVEGPAAYELLRVLVKGKDAYQPPTSLSERIEAALGLAHLSDPGGDVDYDPSVAIYAVGLCVVDFATAYSADHVNLAARQDPKNIAKFSKIPTLPWRIDSERFRQAAKQLVAGTAKGTQARANAHKLEKEINQIADLMRNYNAVTEPLKTLTNVTKACEPKSGQLYKVKGPQVDLESLRARSAENIE